MRREELVEAVRRACLSLRGSGFMLDEVDVAGLTVEYLRIEEDVERAREPFGGCSRIVLLHAAYHCRMCFACSAEFGAKLYERQVRLNLFLDELVKRGVLFRLEEEGDGAGTLYLRRRGPTEPPLAVQGGAEQSRGGAV